jgi:hypothetical protein
MNGDMEELLRVASYMAEAAPSMSALLSSLSGDAKSASVVDVRVIDTPGGGASERAMAEKVAPLLAGSRDPGGLATEVSRLTEVTRATAATNEAPPKSTANTSSTQENGIGQTMLRTAAMLTGVGPIVTGLMKLFGSSEPEPLPALEKFAAPSSVSVSAGLTSSRQFGAIRYAQGDSPEVLPSAEQQAQAPSVQINIQAMDSQSFLDRQDDIARAVREAMLHSSSLNDVVLEL